MFKIALSLSLQRAHNPMTLSFLFIWAWVNMSIAQLNFYEGMAKNFYAKLGSFIFQSAFAGKNKNQRWAQKIYRSQLEQGKCFYWVCDWNWWLLYKNDQKWWLEEGWSLRLPREVKVSLSNGRMLGLSGLPKNPAQRPDRQIKCNLAEAGQSRREEQSCRTPCVDLGTTPFESGFTQAAHERRM